MSPPIVIHHPGGRLEQADLAECHSWTNPLLTHDDRGRPIEPPTVLWRTPAGHYFRRVGIHEWTRAGIDCMAGVPERFIPVEKEAAERFLSTLGYELPATSSAPTIEPPAEEPPAFAIVRHPRRPAKNPNKVAQAADELVQKAKQYAYELYVDQGLTQARVVEEVNKSYPGLNVTQSWVSRAWQEVCRWTGQSVNDTRKWVNKRRKHKLKPIGELINRL